MAALKKRGPVEPGPFIKCRHDNSRSSAALFA
jgi:hypothetical protein